MNSYQLLDCGNFNKLEQIGPYRIVRPSPQAVWSPRLPSSEWKNVDDVYIRTSEGKGYWKNINPKMPQSWIIQVGSTQFLMKKTSFGHTGIFFEQYSNWEIFNKLVNQGKSSRETYKVLNLFAYTGGATIACAQAGAHVTHVDASKTSNQWAQENSELNNLKEAPIRYITEDAKSFVEREIRRGNQYHALILDPPSFGRGTKNQVWKIEEDMIPFLNKLSKLMAKDFHFISLSSHSPGYTPISLKNLLHECCQSLKGSFHENEMVIPFKKELLPSGTTCIFTMGEK